jgi:hypothetical protein
VEVCVVKPRDVGGWVGNVDEAGRVLSGTPERRLLPTPDSAAAVKIGRGYPCKSGLSCTRFVCVVR